MHRLIMTSTAYRQSSRRESAGRRCRRTRWYGRYPVRRLDAEALRDRVLDASGRLDRTLFGPPVPIAEDAVGQVNAANDSPRRSLYLQVRRTQPVVVAGRLRRAGDGGQLRPADAQHLGPAGA